MEPTRSLQTILLVDDDPNDRLLATRELRQEFPTIHIQEAVTWEQFEEALDRNNFDLVITDYDLQWSTGLDVLRAVRARYADRPVVMFTDSGTQEVAVEAMKAGLNDYVLKSPKHLIRLSQAVQSVWENAQVRRRASDLEFRLQFLLNELKVGVFRATPDGQLLEASDGLLRLFGARNLAEAQAFFQNHIGLGMDAHTHGPQWHREIEIPETVDQFRWLQVSETTVMMEGYELIDGLVSDITHQKQTAIALKTLNQSLEHRIAQRTNRLELLNYELEMFAFSVSHDLRSPIRQIDGFAAFLEERLRTDPALAHFSTAADDQEDVSPSERSPLYFVSRIRLLTTRAGRMIDDLLQYSRTGRAKMTYADVSMERLVQEAVRQVEHQLEPRTVRWQIAPLPVIRGDRALLRKVWQNLIENALKYTRQRSTAEITIGSQPGDNETIFFIRDNGIGFDANEADRLFGVFQRLPNASDFDGTGIGLANVQRVIHRHQGRIWAEGKLDQGATFYFSLPNIEPV
jgi:signal transduction histidine kinase